MKSCIICNETKPLESFYLHNRMKDGRLNKCKDCCKKQANERHYNLSKDSKWIESERERHRSKYHRLGYKEKQKEWNQGKDWKKSSVYKNLSRKFKIENGYELHHWNYNDEYLEDVVIMPISDHRRLHANLTLNGKIFETVDGVLLDSKEKHLKFIDKCGFNYHLNE